MDGARLRAERKRIGLTQSQLAQLLDVQQRTISEWERGEVTIRHGRILEMALRCLATPGCADAAADDGQGDAQ